MGQIFPAREVSTKKGWVVDLSKGDAVNPDCYWFFPTRREAKEFLALVESGEEAWRASAMIYDRRERQKRPRRV